MSMLFVNTSSCLRESEGEGERGGGGEKELSGVAAMFMLFVFTPYYRSSLLERGRERERELGGCGNVHVVLHLDLWFSVEVQGFRFKIAFCVDNSCLRVEV